MAYNIDIVWLSRRCYDVRVQQHNINCTHIILPGIRLRNDVVDDHVNHRTRGKRQGVRQQRLDERNGEYAHQSGDRLHHATKLSVPVEKKLE